MNMFLHELRQGVRSLLLWCLGVLFLVGASVAKTSGMAGDEGQTLETMVMLLPKAMQRMFGFGVVDFTEPIGIFAIIAMYLALIVAFHAVGLGVASFAKEERDRTFEFLYVRGRTRGAILFAKLTADLAQMAVLNAFTFWVSVAIVQAVEGADIAARFFPMVLGIFVMQLVFYGLGLLISLLTHRLRTASSAASGVLMALFILSLLAEMTFPDAPVKWLSPFAAFDGKRILVDGLSGSMCAIWLTLAAAMVAASFAMHQRRDLHT